MKKNVFRGVLSSLTVATVLAGASPAWAQDDKAKPAPPPATKPAPPPAAEPAPPAAPAPSGAAAEVKAAKGVENREPVEEGASFPASTKVWVWSRITGAKDT